MISLFNEMVNKDIGPLSAGRATELHTENLSQWPRLDQWGLPPWQGKAAASFTDICIIEYYY